MAATLVNLRRLGCQALCRLRPAAPAPTPLSSSWLGGVASASSKASRKKSKPRRYSHVVPPRQLRQQDGDFPLQLRPSKPREVRDLQDSALDAEAAVGMDKAKKPKPHLVREAVREKGPRIVGTVDDKILLRSLQHKRTQAPEVTPFDPEKDLKEEDAAELAAMKARAQAKRHYKWMPNPFGPKPDVLGTDPESEAKYYEKYIDGRRPTQDKRLSAGDDGEELREDRRRRPRRERISPKRFWYKSDYVTPEPSTVAFMNSRELKFAMVNEAHLVRKWRDEQPEGPAAGLPPGTHDVWMAFGYRAAEVATGRDKGDEDAAADTGAEGSPKGLLPPNRCSLCTTLRFLQALASVQAGPYTALQTLTTRALQHSKEMKPLQCFYFLQALSRLRLRHPKAVWVLERMSLTWRTLPDKKFVKTANAVAKLDLGSNMWARPLKLALANFLPRLSGRHLANLKAITVMELLDDPAAMRSYLECCERTRSQHWYPRHLQVIEMHVHLIHPDLWEDLDDNVRLFLQEVRTAAERTREPGNLAKARRRRKAKGSPGSSSEDSDGESSDSDTDSDSDSETEGRLGYAKRGFSSPLHEDISRVLSRVLGVEHQNGLVAGPLKVDICHVPTMTVVEAAAKWQFYLRSSQITALARRRQELIRAMGFRLLHVPYHRWEALEDDDAKAAYLRERLPPGILPRAQASFGPAGADAGSSGTSSRARAA